MFFPFASLVYIRRKWKSFFYVNNKNKKSVTEMHAHVDFFSYRIDYKNPQHNSHSETTHILYVCTQQYLSSRKTSICNHFPFPQGPCILRIVQSESAFAFYALCRCIYIKGVEKIVWVSLKDVHSLQVERVKVAKLTFLLIFLNFALSLLFLSLSRVNVVKMWRRFQDCLLFRLGNWLKGINRQLRNIEGNVEGQIINLIKNELVTTVISY